MKILLYLLRKILGIPQPKITPEEALAIAKEEWRKRGWNWRHQEIWMGGFRVVETLKTYEVQTRSIPITAIVIDNQEGKVIEVRVPPR